MGCIFIRRVIVQDMIDQNGRCLCVVAILQQPTIFQITITEKKEEKKTLIWPPTFVDWKKKSRGAGGRGGGVFGLEGC